MLVYFGHMIVWASVKYPIDPKSFHYRLVSYAYFSFYFIWVVEVIITIFISRFKFFYGVARLISIAHFLGCSYLVYKIVMEYNVFGGEILSTLNNGLQLASNIKQNDQILVYFRSLLILRATTAVKYFYNITAHANGTA